MFCFSPHYTPLKASRPRTMRSIFMCVHVKRVFFFFTKTIKTLYWKITYLILKFLYQIANTVPTIFGFNRTEQRMTMIFTGRILQNKQL